MSDHAAGKPAGSDSENAGQNKLTRRDWILLPLIGLLTIVLLVAAVCVIGWRMFPQTIPAGYASIYDCIRGTEINDHMSGSRNAVCRGNGRDEPAQEYRLNSRGHRAGMELTPKAPGTYRIVMVGSSVGVGEGVEMHQTMAALLPQKLSHLTGRKVELYNQSMFNERPDSIAAHFSEITPAEPDLVLWLVTANDIASTPDLEDSENPVKTTGQNASATEGSLKTKIWRAARLNLAAIKQLGRRYRESPPMMLLQHLVSDSESQYIKAYLMGNQAQYLKADLNSDWQHHLHFLEIDEARAEEAARAAGVTLVTVFIPDRAHAAIISAGNWPAGFDPYKVDNAFRSMVASHGGIYLDIVPDFRSIPNAEQYYFLVSDHPNTEGQVVISNLIAKHLTNGVVPPLDAGKQGQGAPMQESQR